MSKTLDKILGGVNSAMVAYYMGSESIDALKTTYDSIQPWLERTDVIEKYGTLGSNAIAYGGLGCVAFSVSLASVLAVAGTYRLFTVKT